MKALVGAFNQEKALVGAFSVITKLRMKIFEALVFTVFTSSFPWRPENGDMTVSSISVSHRQLSSRCHAVSRTEKLS